MMSQLRLAIYSFSGPDQNRLTFQTQLQICYTYLVCGETLDDFRGLTDEETAKYLDRFAEPEDISQEEVEADMGFTFYSW